MFPFAPSALQHLFCTLYFLCCNSQCGFSFPGWILTNSTLCCPPLLPPLTESRHSPTMCKEEEFQAQSAPWVSAHLGSMVCWHWAGKPVSSLVLYCLFQSQRKYFLYIFKVHKKFFIQKSIYSIWKNHYEESCKSPRVHIVIMIQSCVCYVYTWIGPSHPKNSHEGGMGAYHLHLTGKNLRGHSLSCHALT